MSDILLEGIKTQAGAELIIWANENFGSIVWGKIIDSVKAIEQELT